MKTLKVFCISALSIILFFIISCNSNSADEPLVPPVEEDVELTDSEFDFVEDESALFSDATIEAVYNMHYPTNELKGRSYHYDIDKYGYDNKHYGIGYKAFNSVSDIDTLANIYSAYKRHFPDGIDWQKKTLVFVGVTYSNWLQSTSDGFSVYQNDGKFKIYINILPIPGVLNAWGNSCHFVVIDKPGVKTSHIRSYALPLRSHIDYFENK